MPSDRIDDRSRHPKPVLGLCGAPGSGKSAVAAVLAGLGCAVLDADALARAALEEPAVRASLAKRWGGGVFQPGGAPDRAAIAAKVFADPAERAWLESVIHPLVRRGREAGRLAAFADPNALAVVEDCPLLFEMGLDAGCDAVFFVDAPREQRLARVAARGWTEEELARREKSQWPLDTKRGKSDHVVSNDAGREVLAHRVREVFGAFMASWRAS